MKKLLVFLVVVVLSLTLVSCTNEIMSMLPPEISSMIPGMQHTCADANADTKCDTCGEYVAPQACKTHVDNNNDGVCDKQGCNATVDMVMDSIVFKDKKVTYNGKPQSLELKGLPEGAEVDYNIPNAQTDVGSYEITAYITAPGYEDCEVTAELTIKKKSISIIWPDTLGMFPNVGKVPEIEYTLDGVVEGDVVEVNFNFGDCDFFEDGDFIVTATSANPNYSIKTANGANKAPFTVGEVICIVLFEDDTKEGKDPLPQKLGYGDTLIAPEPIKSGYELIGWYDDKDNLWSFDNPVTGDMTLTAKWKMVDYKIEYHTNGGTNPSTNPTTCNVETGIKVEAPTRDGRIFLGWYTDSACTKALSSTSISGDIPKTIHLYAKWSTVEYTTLLSAPSLNDTFTLAEHSGSGLFRYTFSANVKEFGEDGVIRIGSGDTVIEITATSINVYDGGKEDKTHALTIDGHVVIDITVNNGVNVALTTTTGTSNVYRDFGGMSGAVTVTAENAELERCELGWAANAYEEPVWILGDYSLSATDKSSWVNKLRVTNYITLFLLNSEDKDSGAILDAFKSALEISAPKYALWSFPSESGETYDANLAEFIAVCKEKEIIPILTTELVAFNPANETKNAAVKASGERYVDFAYLESYSGSLYEDGYTALGADAMFTQVLVDFPEIIAPNTAVKTETAEILNLDNPTLNIANVKLKDGKVTVFTAKLDGTLDGVEKIIIGHGYGMGYSGWLEISEETVKSYRAGAHGDPTGATVSHNLTIKNFITIVMLQDQRLGKKYTIITDGGSFSGTFNSQACNGWIAVQAEGGAVLTEAKGHYTGLDYDAPIWAFGASYFSLGDAARWPNYLYADNYDKDVMLVGVGGLGSVGGIEQLKDALQYATPKIIVWGYGINDGQDTGDTVDKMNSRTYAGHKEFLEICEANGIIPVFFSTPALPGGKHQAKINGVLNREGYFADFDYRVAALPHAVNAYVDGSTWYPGMLHTDNVHPTALGARNMYMELLCAVPEIMIGNDAELMQTEKVKEQLSGTPLKIDTPEFVEKEYGFTFIADFTGDLEGAVEVGSGKDVEGGSWVKVTKDKIEVYTRLAGSDKKVAEFNNEIVMNDIIMLKVHVVDGVASISLVSSAEKEGRVTSGLFTVSAPWGYAGDAFAVADSTRLNDAQLSFVYEK